MTLRPGETRQKALFSHQYTNPVDNSSNSYNNSYKMNQNQHNPAENRTTIEFRVNYLSQHHPAMKKALNGLFIRHTDIKKGDFLATTVIFLEPEELEYLFYLGKQFSYEILNSKP